MKVAIVCDWIDAVGGAERVIKALHDTFPDAPIYTSTCDESARRSMFKGADIRTSWLQKLPKKLRKRQLLTIPRQFYFGHLKLRGYDVVISAGSAEAKAVRAPDGRHINICYTPTLYYWVKPENYLQKGTDGQNALWRLGLRVLLPIVKRWDLKASKRPDELFAISTAVQTRIKKYYHRDSKILHPPADISRFANNELGERRGFVTFGRQAKHKRFDLAIAACNEANVELTVIGDGPEHEKLKAMAGPKISFKTKVSDTQMVEFIARAEAFIFPNEEDYGIVAVEAQAAGTPVIAYGAGGSLDTVVDGVSGMFFDHQTPQALAKVLKDFNPKKYQRKNIIANAAKFSDEVFARNIKRIVEGK